MTAFPGPERAYLGEQLPQSLAATAPSTSFPSDFGSRSSSFAIRRRSGATPSTDNRVGLGDKPLRSLGGTTYIQNGKKYKIKEGPHIEDLLMPDRRTCFPSWPSYLTMLAFVAFWAGFIAIGVIAFRHGKPSRLTHPTDMFGFSCGEMNDWNGISVDLRDRELLYWLDPFELTNPRNRWFAKGICVSSCPAPQEVCRMKDVPCTSGNMYRCPYYALAQDELYGTLPYEQTWGTQYFDALKGTSQSQCWATQKGIPEIFDSEKAAFVRNSSSGAQRCGEFYQLTSLYPGTGPCYANWAYSTVYLNKCIPVFPPEVESKLTDYKRSHPNDTRTNDPLVQPMSGWDVGYYLLDVINGWQLILFSGFVAPAVLAVVVMLLMLKRPGIIIWLGLVFCVLTMLADALLSFVKAGSLGSMAVGGDFKEDVPEGANTSARARKLWIAIGSLLAFATCALFVLAVMLGRHIKLVVNLIRATSRVVRERPLVLLMPAVPLILYGGLALFWVWSTIYLFTSSSIEPVQRSSLNGITTWWSPNSTLPIRAYELLNLTAHAASPAAVAGRPLGGQKFADPMMECAYDPDCYLALTFDRTLQHLFTYNYFGFWLANEFITTVTGVCIVFYLSHHFFILADDTRPRPVGFWNAVACTWLALPPLMVGTFTNAVVDWFVILRPICSMIDKSMSKKPRREAESRCRSIFCAPLRGIGYTASKLMKYSNRHGYYCGALYNRTYWQGCRISAKLAQSSEDRLAGAFESAGSVFLMCKGAVAGLSILMALVWSMTTRYGEALEYPETYLSNALLPVFFCILSAYFVAELWAQVYEASLAVLLLGYCEDCRVHGGKPSLSPGKLVDALKAAAAEEARRERPRELRPITMQMQASRDILEALPHEEMILDAQLTGVEPNRRNSQSIGTML